MGGEDSGKQSIWTISNIITITRILLVPVFVAALLCPWPEWFALSSFDESWKPIVATIIFVLISCTDWLDGYLARRLGQVTDFGKFMDPLADKILVTAALIALVELGELPTWVVLIILAREFIVSGVRMMAASQGVVIAASWLGKFKTVFQMIAIVLFTIKESHMVGSFDAALGDALWVVSWIVMLIAVALTIASMIDYLSKARDLIGLGNGPSKENAQGEASSSDVPVESRASEMHLLDDEVLQAAQRVIDNALAEGYTLTCAESLTGGLIGAALTSIPGSSAVFKGGVISYVNDVKHEVLGVDSQTLETVGAVSEETAMQMARGARDLTGADKAVAVTGIAGPGGAEPGKPVGTVWIGTADAQGAHAHCCNFSGSRDEVRRQTVLEALDNLL